MAMRADAAIVNVLQNPGFETGTFSGWTVGGNSALTGVDVDGTLITGAISPFPPNFVNVRSGAFAAYGLVAGSPIERFIISQTVSVLPNQIATVGFNLGNDSQSGFGMTIDDLHTQIFINGVGLLPNQFVNGGIIGSTPADFAQFSGSFNTGSNTSITVAFAINGSGTSRVGLSLDDLFFDTEDPNVVPEPASLALFGVGALGLAGAARRRRQAA